jgi:hypothetical protein
MRISGHRTNFVFKRYNIVDTADVEQAMEQMNKFYQAEDAGLVPPRCPTKLNELEKR